MDESTRVAINNVKQSIVELLRAQNAIVSLACYSDTVKKGLEDGLVDLGTALITCDPESIQWLVSTGSEWKAKQADALVTASSIFLDADIADLLNENPEQG